MKKFAVALVCFTLAGLCYVYAEVEAVKVGYTIRKLDETKTLLMDRGRALKYNISSLKAPNNLERRLVAQRILLESPKSWQTLVVPNPAAKRSEFLNGSLGRPLGKFFVGTAQAEAKEQSSR